jgi:hypothetical protein
MDALNNGRSIFISYRRADAEGEAGRLYDDLVRAYGDSSVFMDVSGIQPGLDFRKAIDANVSGCGVLLAVVGPGWASVTGSNGTRRLDNPEDYVRLEIATALARGIPVIPVLVHEAHMPTLEQLPDDLKDLRYRNSVEITHARWNSDVALLIGALKGYVTVNVDHETETVHATVPVQLPAPQSSASAPDNPPAKSKLPVYLGIGVAALIVLGAGIFAMTHIGASPAPHPLPQPQPATPSAEAALLGKWQNATEPPGADDLARISVADFNGQIMVEGWGKCANRLCNWGPKKATWNGSTAVTETWDLRNTPQENKEQRSATLSIQPSGSGLQVTVQNTRQMPNGQTKQSLNPLQFVKMP